MEFAGLKKEGDSMVQAPEGWAAWISGDAQAFLQNPAAWLRAAAGEMLMQAMGESARFFITALLGLLLLWVLLQFLPSEDIKRLVEKIGIIGIFLSGTVDIPKQAALLAQQTENWVQYLYGFVPVFGAALAAGGYLTLAGCANGLFLAAMAALSGGVRSFFLPLLQGWTAVMLSFWLGDFPSLLRLMQSGLRLLQKLLYWAAGLLCAIIGLVRLTSGSLSGSTKAVLQGLSGSVPIIGTALRGAVETVASALLATRSLLGLSAILYCGASYAPLLGTYLISSFFCRILSAFAEGLSLTQGAVYCNLLRSVYDFFTAVTAFFLLSCLGALSVLMSVGG